MEYLFSTLALFATRSDNTCNDVYRIFYFKHFNLEKKLEYENERTFQQLCDGRESMFPFEANKFPLRKEIKRETPQQTINFRRVKQRTATAEKIKIKEHYVEKRKREKKLRERYETLDKRV